MSQLFVDASLVVYLSSRGLAGGRLEPFVEAGGGYLRQFHGRGRDLSGYYATDSGQVYHVGGGARYLLRRTQSGPVNGYGLRFDARYYIRNGGFWFDGRTRPRTFVAGGGLRASALLSRVTTSARRPSRPGATIPSATVSLSSAPYDTRR